MTQQHTLASILAEATARKEIYQSSLDDFQERFEKSPTRAFKWADTAMDAAVKIGILDGLISACQDAKNIAEKGEEAWLEFIVGYFEDDALTKAARVASSTSRCMNQLEDFERAYAIEVAGYLRGRFLCSL